MNKYLLIRNNKAKVKVVFDYLSVNELTNPNDKQKAMLSGICDGVEVIEEDREQRAKEKMKPGDWLYRIIGEEKELVRIVNHKTDKP